LELLFCSIVVLVVFLLRDVYLLSGYAPLNIVVRCAIYLLTVSTYDALSIRAAIRLTPSQASEFIQRPEVWLTTVLFHCVLAGLGWWFRSLPRRNCQAWWLTVLPAPAQMLASGAVALELSGLVRASPLAGFWLIPAWVGAALLGVVIFRSLNQDLGDGDQAAELAQVVNVLGLSVLPFRHLFSQPENRLQALNRTLVFVVAAPTTVALLTMLLRKRVK
jgi:hypothetical protein